MKKLYALFAGLWILGAVACNDNDLGKYDTPDCRLNFWYYTNGDSVTLDVSDVTDQMRKYSFSFMTSSSVLAERDTVWFDVETMGFLSDEARPVAMRQIPVEGVKNAEPGVHYVAFDDPEVAPLYRIEGKKNRGKIPVVVLRAQELKKSTVVLKFGFKENEYFTLGYDGLDTRTMEITDRLAQPESWYKRYGAEPEYGHLGYCIANYIGHYGEKKHSFMLANTPLKWDNACIEEIMEGKLDVVYVNYIYAKLRKGLAKLNEELGDKGPLKEDDGTVVSFESDFTI